MGLALNWFKDHFIKCHERAARVKTWLPAQYNGPPTFLDQLVYDRALTLVSVLLTPIESRFSQFNEFVEPDCCEEGAFGPGAFTG